MLTLLDLTYDYLLKKKQASFKQIFNYVKKQQKITPADEIKEKANLYTDIVLDNRFLLVKDNEFVLRENCKFEEVRKQFDFLFSMTEKELVDCEALPIDSNFKEDEVENSNSEDEENEIELDEEDEKID